MLPFTKYKRASHRITVKGVPTVLAFAASLVLTGIPAEVCESVITDVYHSIIKKIGSKLN